MKQTKFGWSPHLLILLAAVAIWSGISAREFAVWRSEVVELPIAIAVWMFVMGKRVVLHPTYLVQCFVVTMFILDLIGGHYGYSDVPFFEDTLPYYFHFQRNHYDRVTHFFQGMVVILVGREYLLRNMVLRERRTVAVFCIFMVLTFASLCEMYEWIVVEVVEKHVGIEYLGAQGDDFDTQKDMFMAFCGGIFCLLTLTKYHDRQLKKFDEG